MVVPLLAATPPLFLFFHFVLSMILLTANLLPEGAFSTAYFFERANRRVLLVVFGGGCRGVSGGGDTGVEEYSMAFPTHSMERVTNQTNLHDHDP